MKNIKYNNNIISFLKIDYKFPDSCRYIHLAIKKDIKNLKKLIIGYSVAAGFLKGFPPPQVHTFIN